MDYVFHYNAFGDDLNVKDIVKVEGETHLITGPMEDEGDLVFYPTSNLDGGDDGIMVDPAAEYPVYGY